MCLFRLYSHYGSVAEPTWWQVPLVWAWQGHVFNVYGFFYAWAYIAVGAWMAMNERWHRVPRKWFLFLLAISLVLATADTNTLVSVFYQSAALALVTLCLRWNIKRESRAFRWCRSLSTYIYLVHLFIIALCQYLTTSPWPKFALSVAGSIVAAWLLITLKQGISHQARRWATYRHLR